LLGLVDELDRKLPVQRRFIDDAVVSCYRKPASYTGENVVEIATHGSPIIVADVLESLYAVGVRPASPGEFTYRAFINGRIDLTQAEAVADLIAARSRSAVDAARRQMEGSLREELEGISDKLAALIASLELELDFTEEDVELLTADEKLNEMNRIERSLRSLLEGFETGRRSRRGVVVAIAGKPNVGKSSLFNALAGEDKAIVHDKPGTTRDVIEACCMINGVEFRLFDTAGMREAPGDIEEEGVRRAKKTAASADIIIDVHSFDTEGGEPDDIETEEFQKSINVLNKVDLIHRDRIAEIADEHDCLTSATRNKGIEHLRELLFENCIAAEGNGQAMINRERHFRAIQQACNAIERGGEAFRNKQPSDIVVEELREGLASVDTVTGRNRLAGILDDIFSGFCIGK